MCEYEVVEAWKRSLPPLLDGATQDRCPFQKRFQLVSDFYGSDARRCSGENIVSRPECEELGNIADNFVHFEDHIGRIAFLAGLSVFFHFKVQLIRPLREFCFGNELSYGGRVVESLADFPWQAFLAAMPLDVPGGKIESEGIGIVIVRGELGGDILAHLADSQDQFGLVMQFLAEIWDVERPVPDQQRRVRLAEEHRLFRHLGAQFHDMFPVILSYADDFHRFLCLKKCYMCY